jgi:hypothetical protein
MVAYFPMSVCHEHYKQLGWKHKVMANMMYVAEVLGDVAFVSGKESGSPTCRKLGEAATPAVDDLGVAALEGAAAVFERVALLAGLSALPKPTSIVNVG